MKIDVEYTFHAVYLVWLRIFLIFVFEIALEQGVSTTFPILAMA